MMTEDQIKERIAGLEKQRADLSLEINRIAQLQASLNAVDGALIVLREVLGAPEQPTSS